MTEILLFTHDTELMRKTSKILTGPQAKSLKLSTADRLPLNNRPDILILDMRVPDLEKQQLMSILENNVILLFSSFREPGLRKNGQWQFARMLTIDTMEIDLVGLIHSCIPSSAAEKNLLDFLHSRSSEILNLFRKRFWADVIFEIIPQQAELLDTMADGILLDKKYRSAVPILIKTRDSLLCRDAVSAGRLGFYIGNLATRYIAVGASEVIDIDRDALLFLSYVDGDPSFFADNCKNFVAVCEQMYSLSVSCCVGKCSSMMGMPQQVHMLEDLADNNIGEETVICLDALNVDRELPDEEPQWGLWTELLSSGRFDEMLIAVTDHLRRQMKSSTRSHQYLARFTQDYTQLLYGVLSRQNISAHSLFNTVQSADLMRNSSKTLEDALLWIHYSVSRFSEYISGCLNEKTAVAIVSDYIEVNISDPFSRQTLADLVHFSPGHLARLFKKEMGMSVTEYVFARRMAKAKVLLAQTDIPVTEIAEKVGYRTYSTFFSRFKDFTGTNPTDYRKRYSLPNHESKS